MGFSENLRSLLHWEVDLSASIAEQNARIDRRKISRSQRQKEMGQLRDRIKRKMVAAALIAWYAAAMGHCGAALEMLGGVDLSNMDDA